MRARKGFAGAKLLVTCGVVLALLSVSSSQPAYAGHISGARGVAGGHVLEGGLTSDNVEWVTTLPLAELPTAISGKLVGKYFYVRGLDHLTIVDVRRPAAPRIVSQVRLDASAGYPPPGASPAGGAGVEDLDTNGRIALFTTCCRSDASVGSPGDLVIIDVSDKADPSVLSVVQDRAAHTYTCLLDCTWAYGSSGTVVDLRDPAAPKVLEDPWNVDLPAFPVPSYEPSGFHDVTEVRPGIIATAGVPMYLLDARKNPGKPRLIAQSDGSPHSFGGVFWPNRGKDPIGLSWSESYQMPRCEIRDAAKGTSLDSAFKTWNMREWKSGLITGLDTYYITNGTYTDGEPAFSGTPPTIAGCSASWFEPHPTFRRGGLVAMSATAHGVKFLSIDDKGSITPVDWFLPYDGNSVASYWITKRIVYSTDGYRGIDVLRFNGAF